MSARFVLAAVAACLFAAVAAAIGVRVWADQMSRIRRRKMAYGRFSTLRKSAGAQDARGFGLRYAVALTRKLYANATPKLCLSVREGKASETRAGMWYQAHAKPAGCSKGVSTAGFCEARTRLGAVGCVAGVLLGVPLSNELALLLGLAGALVGLSAPKRAVRAACKQRSASAQRHLSEMLEVVALGLRSGLTFDRSFALYGEHFTNDFAQSCARAHRSWALGLVSREEALRELASTYECEQLARVVDSVVRSLRFGSSLTGVLEEAAAQSRAEWRTALEERVAKAPVKMMLPTGTLILPAMLLLVMGPILLELAGGF